MNGLVLRDDNQGVATLTLNRPDKLNALSKDLFEELEDHIDLIARDTKRTGLVILR
jgi:enoyl-CoA hydratase